MHSVLLFSVIPLISPSHRQFDYYTDILVRPHLKYASLIWSPYFRKHMLPLKKIQRRFLLWALVSRTCHDYSPIMSLLNLRSLEEHRWCRWSAFVTWNDHTNSLYISALIDFNASHTSLSKSLLFQCHAYKSKYFHWDSPKSYFLPS